MPDARAWLQDRIELDDIEMRVAYCEALMAEAGRNPQVVSVDADVQHSMGTLPFYDAFPDRGINCGIMEAHAVGMCAGMSATGLVPFFHTFGTFATRRAFDQVFVAAGFQDLNVKIIGGDAGVSATSNGGTHMPFEDMGLCREVPGMTIVEPADVTMYPTLVHHMAATYGNFYVRSTRRKVMRVYRDGAPFVVGRANLLADGTDVALIACGIMVAEALAARQQLAGRGISAAVVDMHTVKPIDAAMIVEVAGRCGAVVTAENHNATGALGSAVAEVLAEQCPVPMQRVGVFESFGEVGTQEFLQRRFGLTAEDIVARAIEAVGRKKP